MKHTFTMQRGIYLIGGFIALFGFVFILIRSDVVLKIPLFAESHPTSIQSQTVSQTDGAIDSYLILDSKGDELLATRLQERFRAIGKQSSVMNIEHLTSLKDEETVIVATEHLDRLKDRDILLDYVENGGTVLFATRPSPSDRLMEMYRQIGVIEIGSFVETTGVRLTTSYFEEDVAKSFDSDRLLNSSLALRIDPDANLLATSSQDIPLLWSKDYGAGRFIVFNGTMLSEFNQQALLFVGLTQGKPLLRPILNAEVTTLQGFPFFASNERLVTKSMTDRDYFRNVFWADLQRLGAKYGLNYVLATTSPSLNPTPATSAYSEDLALYGRETLRSGGEIAVSGSSFEEIRATKQQVDYALPGLTIKSSYQTDGELARQVFDHATTEIGTASLPIKEDAIIKLPSTPFELSDPDWTSWAHFNELVTSGSVSMTLSPQTITAQVEGEALITAFQSMLDEQGHDVPWLRSMKVSDVAQNHHFFNGHVYVRQSEDLYTYTLDEAAGETYFYLQSPREVTDVDQCEVERIGPNLYLVKTEALSFSIRLEAK
ncbi:MULTISPECIES: DUF2194 domain-containing protein [unclassified Exiguobacterium]|uniref:DUF2194 domain-containing protein n=1 Tax=unclassified Exiguobacterium TaxID=2644629 RepID=UPI001BE8F66B|nr:MULTISPECIES: DUF2194 domain-containing protein [unclassified Exiguobacterium]